LTIAIEVRTRLDRQGKLVPVDCIFQGKKYQITGVGRRWQAEDGEHLMVMFPRERAVELLHCSDGSWMFVKDHSNLGERLA
jgi:hypothetical protein